MGFLVFDNLNNKCRRETIEINKDKKRCHGIIDGRKVQPSSSKQPIKRKGDITMSDVAAFDDESNFQRMKQRSEVWFGRNERH